MKKMKYKRILLKLSGEFLEGEKGAGIDFSVMDELCKEISDVRKMGTEIAIVLGGGNFWRYRDFKDSAIERVHSDYMGMMATIMNSVALTDHLKKFKVPAVTMSAFKVPVAEKYNRDKAVELLKQGSVVVCAGGTGNPFFTTDSAASLRALELDCDIFLKATLVDYVYDKDPKKHKDAKKYKKISYDDVVTQRLGVIDLSAVSMCAPEKLPILVFNLAKKGNIKKAVMGEDIGTIIS